MIKLKKIIRCSLYLLLGTLSLLLSSCAIYKQQFDCPPPAGIPCVSVTDIESMIVETEKGTDLLVKPQEEKDHRCFWCGQQKAGGIFPSKSFNYHRKVWICNQKKEGCLMKGHDFQQTKTSSSCQNYLLEAEEFFPCTSSDQKRGK